MSRKIPVTRYRPLRPADAGGGYTETAADPQTVWVETAFHREQLTARVNANEDIRVGDWLALEDYT